MTSYDMYKNSGGGGGGATNPFASPSSVSRSGGGGGAAAGMTAPSPPPPAFGGGGGFNRYPNNASNGKQQLQQGPLPPIIQAQQHYSSSQQQQMMMMPSPPAMNTNGSNGTPPFQNSFGGAAAAAADGGNSSSLYPANQITPQYQRQIQQQFQQQLQMNSNNNNASNANNSASNATRQQSLFSSAAANGGSGNIQQQQQQPRYSVAGGVGGGGLQMDSNGMPTMMGGLTSAAAAPSPLNTNTNQLMGSTATSVFQNGSGGGAAVGGGQQQQRMMMQQAQYAAAQNPLHAHLQQHNHNTYNGVDTSRWRLSDLDLKETLGTGTFGRVRLCKHKTSQQFFALKMIKKYDIIRMRQVDHILSEAAILKEIRHPFVVNMVKGFADEDRLYLLMELVVGGELFSHLRKAGKFPNDVAKFYACEVILAFEYLHERHIIYRDLKPENILLDDGGHIKIADFGFAKKVSERTFTLCGTPEYIAPEVIQSRGHGKAVDYWALGILIYEMIVGYPPFFDESPFKTYEKILEGKLQFPKWVDVWARDIIRALLTADHTKRLGSLRRGVHDLKKHKFFQGVDWEVMLTKKIPAPIPVRVSKDGDSRYFDRYPESPPNKAAKPITPQQQEQFKGFCNGEYGLP